MDERFPHIENQESIDSKEWGYKWFKRYMVVSITMTVIFYVLIIAAIVKYLLS